ncbi:MAG: BatD family protein, partial [Lentisphaerae bacterium]|nr:BatD family protein [Lentisphaerota bacterium]
MQKVTRVKWLLSMSLWLWAYASMADEPQLQVQANRSHIYLGESIILTVKVEGLMRAPEPDISGIRYCTSKLLGSHSDSSLSISFVNGRRQKISSSGRTFTYEITPERAGMFVAGPIVVRTKDKTLTAAGPSVTVSGVDEQDWVSLSVEASKDSVLVDEPFDITMSVVIRRLDRPNNNIDPLDPHDPPNLTVGFLNQSPIDGLESPDIKNILQKLLVGETAEAGFTVNDYTIETSPMDLGDFFSFDGFDIMRRSVKAKFMFQKHAAEKNSKPCFKYFITLRYVPAKEGSYTFGPAEFKGNIIAGVDDKGYGIRQRIFAIGPAVTVRVVPPPEENRPISYIGAIGSRINAEAALDSQTCKVGDPLTLTLSIDGDFRMENVFPPALSQQPAFSQNFRIYDDTVQSLPSNDRRIFTYTIRPTTVGTYELPPIELSYFDTNARMYKTICTAPIPIHANPSEQLNTDHIIETLTNTAFDAASRANETDQLTAAPMHPTPDGHNNQQLFGSHYTFWPIVIGPTGYLLLATILFIHSRAPQLAVNRRRQRALGKALAALTRLERAYESGENSAYEMFTILRQYLIDRFDAPNGVTHSDA